MKERSCNLPRISILTPSYNQGSYIEENIQSVLKQNYPNFEHIIIDGASTDTTIEILKKYPHLKWVSEKDRGQADALNKGLLMASGEIIGWINSDDWYEKDVFSEIVTEFNEHSISWVIGNKSYFDENTKQIRPDVSDPITYQGLTSVVRFIPVSQQPAFFRKSLLLDVGGWNAEFYMKMDRDLWVRLAKKTTPRMVARNWVYFRMHDLQKTCLENSLLGVREIELILQREGMGWLSRKMAVRSLYIAFTKEMLKTYLAWSGLIRPTSNRGTCLK